MNRFENQSQATPEKSKEKIKEEYVLLAQELSEVNEGFPFPGITLQSYANIKEELEYAPEYGTPIDELLDKFRTEGMKVVLSSGDPKSGNIYVLPLNSNDIEMDNLFPRSLLKLSNMDERVNRLISLGQEFKRLG